MDRFKYVKRASILGIIGNFFLVIIKSIVGFMSNSQSMIADAFNSLSDVLSSIMTFIGNRIASKPQDDCHNLGHGKAEYIYSLLISIVMFYLGFQVIYNSIKTLIFGSNFHYSFWLIVVCIITITIKLILFIYTNILSKKINNLLLDANSKDHRNDCLITSLNLISCVLTLNNIKYIDSIIGIIISIWIVKTAFEIFINSYDVLMDKSISDETKRKVLDIIEKYSEIENINHFNSTPVGYQYQISFTIFVDGNLSTFESHDIANRLEKEIDKSVPEIFLTVIHVNPIKKN